MRVVDEISGLEGIVTSRAEHLRYARQYRVESVDSTGRPIDDRHVEERLTRVGE